MYSLLQTNRTKSLIVMGNSILCVGVVYQWGRAADACAGEHRAQGCFGKPSAYAIDMLMDMEEGRLMD